MKIAGKEIDGSLVAIAVGALQVLSLLYGGAHYVGQVLTTIGAHYQQLEDKLEMLDQRMTRVEQAQTDVRVSAAQAAEVLARGVERNEARRDESDRQLRNAIDRQSDEINEISKTLSGRQHGLLQQLPHIAAAGETPDLQLGAD